MIPKGVHIREFPLHVCIRESVYVAYTLFLHLCFRVDMIKSLDGSFKGMWLIDTLRDTIRGAIGKPSSPTCDITELIKFSKVKEGGCFKL